MQPAAVPGGVCAEPDAGVSHAAAAAGRGGSHVQTGHCSQRPQIRQCAPGV